MGSCICTHKSHRCIANTNNETSMVNKSILAETIDKLVLETLDFIGLSTDNEPDLPRSISLLHMVTDKPEGWIELICSLMRIIPVEHPMGPSVIALLLDDSPLPTKECIQYVSQMSKGHVKINYRNERNYCVIIGCLAEKLAGLNSIELLNDITLNYLIENICRDSDNHIKLISLVALEKFAQTSENKLIINNTLSNMEPHPLLLLEKHFNSNEFTLRQIGFCARWCLDNCFLVEGRQYSYETIDVSNINAMLNSNDVSEYLKLSSNGLEARCDAHTFESVRCTYEVSSGCWYYEVRLITSGVMQIGWATKSSRYLCDDGFGIGDDKHSIGFDGCRSLIWHNAKALQHSLPKWKSGWILGCLFDIDKHEILFSLNGKYTKIYKDILLQNEKGYFAAASFMSFQQCIFNFGSSPFCYPPKRQYTNFNSYAQLSPQEKTIIPKHIYLKSLQTLRIKDDSCHLCYDKTATTVLEPCNHRGFCEKCSIQLTFCPLCRSSIIKVRPDGDNGENLNNLSTSNLFVLS